VPRFSGQLQGLKLAKGKFTKVLDRQLQVLVRLAAREWLRAVIIKVPVYTGFALGSVKNAEGEKGNLARFLNVAVPIVPVNKRLHFYYHPGRKRIVKNEDTGAYFSKYAFVNFNKVYRFRFQSDIIYYMINDFFGSDFTGPWNSMDAGKTAFFEYLDANKVRMLPKVSDYLVKINVPFGV
jgi:hypothetical protein